MSNKPKPDAFPPFVTKDGAGTEVWVQRGKGIVENISYKANKTVADISITVNGFNFPVHGWIQVNDAEDATKKSSIFELAQKAFDNNEPVIYRVESQRKKNVPKDIPIADLRETAEKARENTTPILASLKFTNDDSVEVFSVEAVTDPNDDPAPTSGGRVSAIEVNRRKAEENAQNPQPPIQQAPPRGAFNQVPGSISAMEGKPWERVNQDGTPNVGSYSLLSSARTENVVRKELLKTSIEPFDENFAPNPEFEQLVTAYTIILLNIMDKIQGFVTKKQPNRLANSYQRARELVMDTLENVAPFTTVEGDTATMSRQEWYRIVGKVSMERFINILKIDSEGAHFNVDSFLTGGNRAGAEPPAPEPTPQSAPQKPQEAPVSSQNTQTPPSPQNAPRFPQNGTQSEEPQELTVEDMNNLRPEPRETINPRTKAGLDALKEMAKPNPDTGTDPKMLAEVRAQVASQKNGAQATPSQEAPAPSNAISVYPQSDQRRDGENPSKPTNETAELLRSFISDYNISTDDLGIVLDKTFNVKQVINIEEKELAGFVGHYIDQELESPGHFQRVIDSIKKV